MEKVPNIIHFICIKPMNFEFIHYLAVMSAHYVNKPDQIFVYVDIEPENNFYWECVKPYITVEIVAPPTNFRGLEIKPAQYKADIIRLEKLIERGGIYLDIDNLCLHSFEKLRTKKFTMFGWPDEQINDISKLETLSNSIILTEPDSPFLKLWYNEIHKYMTPNHAWSFHAVCLPVKLLQANQNLVSYVTIIEWEKYARPFGWEGIPFIMDGSQNNRIHELDRYYTIVFYQTIVFDRYLKNITPDYFYKNNNILTQLYKPIVDLLPKVVEQQPEIKQKEIEKQSEIKQDPIIFYDRLWHLYNDKNWEKLYETGIIYLKLCGDPVKEYAYALFYVAYALTMMSRYEESKTYYQKVLQFPDIPEDVRIWSTANYELLN